MKKIPIIEDDVLEKYILPNKKDILNEKLKLKYNLDDKIKNHKKLFVEIGSGNGHFFNEIAEIYKDYLFIGVEIKKKIVFKSIRKSNNLKLDNIIFANLDGFLFISEYLSDKSIDGLYVNFPDPWSKKRYRKNRIIQDEFLKVLHKRLKDDGFFYFVSDHFEYLNWTIDKIEENKELFEYCHKDKYLIDIDDYKPSLFSEKWEEDMRDFYFCKLKVKNNNY